MIAPEEARALVPELDAGGERSFVAACYNPTDGIVFPWPFLWGYARAAAQARRRRSTRRRRSPRSSAAGGGGFRAHDAGRGASPPSGSSARPAPGRREVARLVGASLPDRPQRHEILSTEPLKPFLKPMVSVLETGLYVSQSLRGELVGGISMPEEPNADGEVRLGSRLAFSTTMARALVELMPRLGHVKVVRQWAGPYDVSPDGNPIVGELPGVPGFYVVCGFAATAS